MGSSAEAEHEAQEAERAALRSAVLSSAFGRPPALRKARLDFARSAHFSVRGVPLALVPACGFFDSFGRDGLGGLGDSPRSWALVAAAGASSFAARELRLLPTDARTADLVILESTGREVGRGTLHVDEAGHVAFEVALLGRTAGFVVRGGWTPPTPSGSQGDWVLRASFDAAARRALEAPQEAPRARRRT